jgi:protein gp37
MKRTKIDWCDVTVNPIIGCPRGCPYCYAKKLNDRFHFVADFAKPEAKEKSLKPLHPEKPTSIFFDSMSDFAFWSEKQLIDVQGMIAKSDILPGNCFFLGLTKTPEAIARFKEPNDRYDLTSLFTGINCDCIGCAHKNKQSLFLGYSCGDMALVGKADSIDPFEADFLSIEPLTEDIASYAAFWRMVQHCPHLRAVIIGAETGNRAGKAECKKEWVDRIVDGFVGSGIPIFMKSSLKPIMGKEFKQNKLPWPVGEKRR